MIPLPLIQRVGSVGSNIRSLEKPARPLTEDSDAMGSRPHDRLLGFFPPLASERLRTVRIVFTPKFWPPLRYSVVSLLLLVLLFQSVRASTYFAPRTDYATAQYPVDVAIGDLNGDSRLDLVAACYCADSLSLFFGNGDGTFEPRSNLATGPNPRAVAVADLNGDQKLDVVAVEEHTPAFSVRLGNGDGTF